MKGPVKNSVAGNRALAVGTVGDELRVEREHDRAEIGRRIGVCERAAEGAPMANLRIADELGRLRDQRAASAPAPGRERAPRVG